MSTILTAEPVVETAPGWQMPAILQELDFEISGAIATPAKMDGGPVITVSSSCSSSGRPKNPKQQ
ncbi:hypothetical protein [Arthrobacter woluwensis]|uniref:Uncharacterized protein n=1 Tax=Arthrobacter woluwensis TaxID=156980 RepID=A0A1H4I9B1_9MICC|nr:hypothetical protein [Arthrobacter woluwensis]SEB29948.1 hypothetical protein SAMN04489745_0095 [Arthrobacter woluwensis]